MPFRIKYIQLTFLILFVSVGLSSCFISSRSNEDVFNKKEYAGSFSVKTIKVPLFLAKPFIKTYLRQEGEMTSEVRALISSLKKIRITIAQSGNTKLARDFRSAVQGYKGEEWLSVKNQNQWLYLKGSQDDKDIIRRLMVAISIPDQKQLIYLKVNCRLTMDQLSMLVNKAMEAEDGPLKGLTVVKGEKS